MVATIKVKLVTTKIHRQVNTKVATASLIRTSKVNTFRQARISRDITKEASRPPVSPAKAVVDRTQGVLGHKMVGSKPVSNPVAKDQAVCARRGQNLRNFKY